MKKERAAIAVSIAIVGLLFASVTFASSFEVGKTTITLKPSGKTVEVHLRALFGPINLHEIWVDNTPTDTAGFCSNDGGFPVTCDDSSFALIRATINGTDWRPGNMPQCIANNDKLATRMLFDQELSTDTSVPLAEGDELVLVFKTYDSDNRVRLDFRAGYTGDPGFLLLWSGPGPNFDPCDDDCCCGEC